MYLSQLHIDETAVEYDRFRELMSGDGYVPKALVWEAFGDHPDRDRDFIYRPERDSTGPPTIYAASERRPDPPPFMRTEVKPYDPDLREGLSLEFMLRANATVYKDGSRHDVVTDAEWRIHNEGEPERPHPQIVQEEGLAWLEERTERYGFALVPERTRVDTYRKLEFSASNGHPVTIATFDYQGALRVTDPDRLREALFEGIGPSRAYGCGMMMVRPDRRAR